MTPSAIGHQVRALEEWFGTELFIGDGRARRLSPDGERLASALGEAFDHVHLACRGLKRSRRGAELHINMTPTFAIRWLVPRLASFHARHPEISVNIATSAAPIDGARDVVDSAIRFGEPESAGLTAELLFMENIVPVCHPDLLAGHGIPVEPDFLKGQRLLHTTFRRNDWERWLRAAGVDPREVDPTQGLVFDLTTLAIDAAEARLGIAITREAQVEHSLRKGYLVAPFRRDLLSGEGCYLLTRPDRASDPAVVAFRRWLLLQASQVRFGNAAV